MAAVSGPPTARRIGATTAQPVSNTGPQTPTEVRRRGRIAVAFGSLLVTLALIGLGILGLTRLGAHKPPSVATPASAEAQIPPIPAVVPPPIPPGAPAAPAAPPAPPTPAPASAAPVMPTVTKASSRPSVPPKNPPKTNPECSPNFYFDENGNKHFKPECFH